MTTSTLAPAELATRHVINASSLSIERGGRAVVRDVDLQIALGELVVLAGASGSGKTTLIEVLAGLRASTRGSLSVDRAHAGGRIGFVPQDDLVHRDLPLERSLHQAASLTAHDSAADRADRVEQILAELDLVACRAVSVGSLSGGQRKRASIAVELLAQPGVLFLDEPTSGLDPLTAAEVMRALRRLTQRSVTVVLTSHHPQDLAVADRVVFLDHRGTVAYDGPATTAPAAFSAPDLHSIYGRLASPSASSEPVPARVLARRPPAPRPSAWRQLRVLTRRNAEVMARGRLTLAILAGSPVLVITMMVVLFPAGVLDAESEPALGAQAGFWMAFAAFFFGLTYGLLQIVEEIPILRREQRAGVRLPVYVLAKVAVLLPLLGGVVGLLVAVLRALDRLPATSAPTHAAQVVTLLLEALAALALGLLASAAVRSAAQAALALPMLCFPQVLFAGAVVPVAEMPFVGRAASVPLANRWGYEALGQVLRLPGSMATLTPWPRWLTLAGLTVICLTGTIAVLHRRCAAAHA